MKKSLLIFNSTQQALLAESLLEERGIEIDIVALPKEFTSDCGLAIQFDSKERDIVESLLEDGRLDFKAIIETRNDNS